MAPRKSSTTIDSTSLCHAALKAVKVAADYNRIGNTTEPAVLEAAWNKLPESEQRRITQIVNANAAPTSEALASELAACGNKIQLQAIKNEYGELAVKQAWKLLPTEERNRLTSICQNQPTEEPQPVIEEPAVYKVETQSRRSLFNISDDLEKLNDLLDDCGDDSQQQELLRAWFEQLGEERDTKLDNYSALIVEMVSRAAARKAEAQRLLELAATDENRARLLRDCLKWFFEAHDLKTIETPR